jgi:biotin synthase-like enzyme
MPTDVKRFFFEQSEQCNYCYVSHEVMLPNYYYEDDEGNEVLTKCEEHTVIDKWLLDNGAFGGEYVLIKHWW